MKINVLGDKGGVGKSVTAVHLGAALGLRFGEGTTVVYDADPNGSVLEWRAQREEEGDPDLGPWPCGVMGLGDGDAWRDYENVVFDSQGRPSKEDLGAAVEESDLIVVPTTAEGLAVRTLVPFLESVEEMGGGYKTWVLVTMAPWWNNSGRQLRDDLEALEAPAFRTFRRVVRRRQVFDTAALTGRLVYEVPSRRAREAWRDYERVGEEVVEAVMAGRRAKLAGRG